MLEQGVDDWLAYYDHTLSVDEHREVAERAVRDERGDRLDSDTSVADRLADFQGAQGEQCGHARDHCEDGKDEACDFLVEACGFDEEDVETLVADAQKDNPPGLLNTTFLQDEAEITSARVLCKDDAISNSGRIPIEIHFYNC